MADAPCVQFNNCTISNGAETNGTFYVAKYDPNAPVPIWHQNMELATICVCNSLTFLLIVARLWYRRSWLGRLRKDDWWMAAAGVVLIAYTASQIGQNVAGGSGLHVWNTTMTMKMRHWQYQIGFAGYYLVVTLIKISVCFCYLEILNSHQKALRRCVYSFIVLIAAVGTTLTIGWIFGCSPFLSNFLWVDDSNACVNNDIWRWLWIGASIPIDIAIMIVPMKILQQTRLRNHERRILKLVFGATLLGTIACTIGIYGAYQIRVLMAHDLFYNETPFIMMNDVEILLYALGATFPVLSKYLVQRSNSVPRNDQHANFSSWARYAPDFFRTNDSRNRIAMHELTIGKTVDGERVSREGEQGQIPGEEKKSGDSGERTSSYYPDPGEGQSKRSSHTEAGREIDLENGKHFIGVGEVKISGATK